ncbi:type I-U CRISPR-associated protein Csx17 [Amycolatopsis rhizosphaerae]|uniref:Type I-U CRISPR-associated protein Csx17 n=1 Tax=Amycolatopsis rhizosphaerae TaxID=2053003 RepID=A0A558CJC4_9PSEU|nr:type I-U CRISPR-associated protein Csx17 [Amycolatopsis rhizosphaerae]TVT48871.1 type I-U CRISPR-associated protein Csx17 [Amycolatopsis rhizosphaerae]
MPEVILRGCGSTPLGGYLSALGVLRAVTRLLDPEASGYWRSNRLVLRSKLATTDELAGELSKYFEPEAIVSPWNAGSGFAANGKNTTAEAALAWVRDSTDTRLHGLREAVAAGDEVVAQGRVLGWGGKGDDLWDSGRKRDVLQLCRKLFPDAALAWLDAATALVGDEDVAFSRLLGTGGNFGRQDLSVTYLSRLQAIWRDKRGPHWLSSLLNGTESVSYLRDAVGQFDPGRAGGIQSSPFEKADDKGFVNPWALLMTVEGALLFASAVVRRHGADYSGAALPFQVRGATSGFSSAAGGEDALGELWAPEWSAPMRLAELVQLLGEGKAHWRSGPARSALDFVRAIANLGVDRGIRAFQRYVFVDRLGQNPLAIPAGRVEVPSTRRSVSLLAHLDPWLDSLRGRVPSAVASRLRGVEQALFIHATTGKAADLVEVFAAIGHCHETVARSSRAQQAAPPLVLLGSKAIAEALRPRLADDAELRVALALATARDIRAGGWSLSGLRSLLSPVVADSRGRPNWSGRPSPVSLNAGLMAALAEVARRRSMPRLDEAEAGDQRPAVRGARIGFQRGLYARRQDVRALMAGELDEARIADLLAGLLTVEWANSEFRLPYLGNDFIGGALEFLLPFTSVEPLHVPREDGATSPILLRPGNNWPALLLANRSEEVVRDAARRLSISGLPVAVEPPPARVAGERLAAVLLFRLAERDRLRSLNRIAVLPKEKGSLSDQPSDV